MPDDVSMQTKVALLEQQVEIMKAQNMATQARLDAMQATLTSIDRQMSEAKGGWRVLIILGTMMGGLTGVIGFFTGKVTGAS
jgi:multidrug resistance efflux pump